MAKEKEQKRPLPPVAEWAPALALSWLVPGGGHLLLKRTGRGLLLMAAITSMFVCGLMMRGAMFQPESGDLLTTLINTMEAPFGAIWAWIGIGEVPATTTFIGGSIVLASVFGRLALERSASRQ